MRRKRRVIREDVPEGSIPREELKRTFREFRRERLARERQARRDAVASPAPDERPAIDVTSG
jgi:hypothetical protein